MQKAHAAQIRAAAPSAEAAVLGIAAAGAESSLRNVENAGRSTLIDRSTGQQITASQREVVRRSVGLGDYLPKADNLDSIGLFAQRPSQGWGTPEQIMRPDYAIGKFFELLVKVPGWEALPAEEIIARVQGYWDAAVYVPWLATARSLL